MKKLILVATVALCVVACQREEQSAAPEQQAQAGDKSLSYSLGLLVGSQMKGNVDEIQYDDYVQGLKMGFETEVEHEALSAASLQLQTHQQERRAHKGEQALQKGETFRKEHAQQEGVTVTDSGLQYEVLQAGEGVKPQASDKVTVHYRGTLIDGSEFDSSHQRGEPASFPLNGVIKGWTEGLQLMQVGAKYKFVIPPQLAYGEYGSGGRIGPNETLVFEIELLDVQSASEAQTAE